jgi:multisubunit Na+/H+ antiporter MnhB subunit
LNVSPETAKLEARSDVRANDDIAEGNSPATRSTRRGLDSMIWLLIVLIAVIVMLLAMWGRFHSTATSTVNPTKTQPRTGTLH